MNTNFTQSKYFIPVFGLVVFLIVLLILTLGRGGVPDNAVASVDGNAIPKTQFNKVLKIFSIQNQPQNKSNPVLPDPPAFKACIANKRKNQPKKAKSSDKDLKNQCETEWNTAKQQIMTSLIQAQWYTLEAEDRNINASDDEVKKRFQTLKTQTFPKAADYQKFLKNSGQTEQDLLNLVRNQIYQEKIREEVSKASKITQDDIKKYFEENKERFVQPESRDLLIVFNEKKGQAQAASAALKSGDSWTTVAKKYSSDKATSENGGKFPSVSKGQFEPALDKAVFSAKKGVVTGPIKTQFGYYVFAVQKENKTKQQTLKEAEPTIRQAIEAEEQQTKFQAFQKEFEKKWKGKTKCADLYVIELCDNAPDKPEPTQPAGAAGAPQGGGAPPQGGEGGQPAP